MYFEEVFYGIYFSKNRGNLRSAYLFITNNGKKADRRARRQRACKHAAYIRACGYTYRRSRYSPAERYNSDDFHFFLRDHNLHGEEQIRASEKSHRRLARVHYI